MNDQDDNPNKPRCIICYCGKETDPLLRPCKCAEMYGNYHWPCLVQFIEQNHDYPCRRCKATYSDTRLSRFTYSPTIWRYIFSRNLGLTEIILLIIGTVGNVIALSGTALVASNLWQFILTMIIVLIIGFFILDTIKLSYKAFLMRGRFPHHMTRICEHPTAPGGELVLNVTETVTRVNQELMRQANQKKQRAMKQAQSQAKAQVPASQSSTANGSTDTSHRMKPLSESQHNYGGASRSSLNSPWYSSPTYFRHNLGAFRPTAYSQYSSAPSSLPGSQDGSLYRWPSGSRYLSRASSLSGSRAGSMYRFQAPSSLHGSLYRPALRTPPGTQYMSGASSLSDFKAGSSNSSFPSSSSVSQNRKAPSLLPGSPRLRLPSTRGRTSFTRGRAPSIRDRTPFTRGRFPTGLRPPPQLSPNLLRRRRIENLSQKPKQN